MLFRFHILAKVKRILSHECPDQLGIGLPTGISDAGVLYQLTFTSFFER